MKTRKILSVLLTTIILIICISGVAKGYYFDDGPADYYAYFGIDDIWYSYIDESKTSATVVEINNKSKEICVPEKVVNEGKTYDVKYMTFYPWMTGNPKCLETCKVLNIPETMVLWDNNDAKWKKLKAINIPQNSNLISIDGLNNLKKLERINIPKNLENLDGLANCPNLKISGIKISPENEYFKKSKKFLLSDKGKSVNNYFGKSKKVKIPDGVISIKQHAFFNCKSIKAIAMPKGFKKIGYDAFKNCKSLSKVTISNKKKAPKIDTKAFKKTKDGIKFVVKNKKVAKSLTKQLKGSGARNAKIVVKG